MGIQTKTVIESAVVCFYKLIRWCENTYIFRLVLEHGDFKFVQFLDAVLIIIYPGIFTLSCRNFEEREIALLLLTSANFIQRISCYQTFQFIHLVFRAAK